jgi:hypothetical protein
VPELGEGEAHDVPDDAIKLRYLAAILEKRRKFASYVEGGLVRTGDAQVIAINSRCVPSATIDFDPPRIARALYAVGNLAVKWNLASSSISDPHLTRQPFLEKKSGRAIGTNLFDGSESPELCGVIYSWLDAWNRVDSGKPDLLYVANRNAHVPLPSGWLARCGHYESRPPQPAEGVRVGRHAELDRRLTPAAGSKKDVPTEVSDGVTRGTAVTRQLGEGLGEAVASCRGSPRDYPA